MLALILDWLVLIFYFKIAGEIFKSFIESGSIWDGDHLSDVNWVALILFYMPPLVYHALLEITMNGQTIGKKIMGIQVINETGGKASISQLLIRWLLREIWFLIILIIGLSYESSGNKIESALLLLIVVGYFVTDLVLVVSSKKGQRIGDLLAKTILIRVNTKSDIEDTVFQEVADSYVPSYPQIMRLSDRDINAIKGILETARKKGDYAMAENAALKIKSHLAIISPMDPFDFLDVLLKDYNYLSVK
ncbi:MAG: RDD family protein [Chitinophagaceae bacterium]|nr:RDD family protein [Chitinophagaceae bacterium]